VGFPVSGYAKAINILDPTSMTLVTLKPVSPKKDSEYRITGTRVTSDMPYRREVYLARFSVRAGRAIRGPAKATEMQPSAFEWTSSPAPSPELARDRTIANACIRVDTA